MKHAYFAFILLIAGLHISTAAEPLETWRITLPERLEMASNIWVAPDPSEALRDSLITSGIEFPEGASVTIDAMGISVVACNTPQQLKAIRDLIGIFASEISMVRITLALYAMDQKLAKEWGLDGGPATAPETMPIKPPRFPIFTKDYTKDFLLALRKRADVELVIGTELTTISGVTGVVDNVSEMRFPEAKDGDFGESEEVGAILRVTPQVGATGVIDLEMEPIIRLFAGWQPQEALIKHTPVMWRMSVETRIVLQDGDSYVVPGRVIRIPPDIKLADSFPYNGKCMLMILSAENTLATIRHEVIPNP